MSGQTLTADDRRQLEASGIAPEEAERQLALLADPPPPPELVRPATAGDGIERLSPEDQGRLVARYEEAQESGRAMKLVPASGAASRMFRTLLPWIGHAGNPTAAAQEINRRIIAGDHAAGDPLRFLAELPRLPFAGELARALGAQDLDDLRRRGDAATLLHVLLSPDHLDYDALPKALIPFHRYGDDEARTAFVEQLVESVGYLRDLHGICRLHFTVPAGTREALAEHLMAARERYEERFDVRFEVGFSVQSPATDTLAGAPEGGPFRTADGRLLLRPGGHGALIGNLAALDGDVVFVKNIDNLQRDEVREEVVHWKKVLGGYLLELRDRAFELVERLEAAEGGADDAAATEATEAAEAERFLAERLGVRVPEAWRSLPAAERRERLVERLDRPLRVAGMVVNRGEPGGGPYWVRQDDGSVTAQIVERAQIDADSDEQQAIFGASTHFNPVDLVCSLRDHLGRPFDLERYVDPRAVFVADKSHDGRPLRALERPGLWNGAMAGWSSAFVEVPETTFSPVKTVFDLLRPEHQPPAGSSAPST